MKKIYVQLETIKFFYFDRWIENGEKMYEIKINAAPTADHKSTVETCQSKETKLGEKKNWMRFIFGFDWKIILITLTFVCPKLESVIQMRHIALYSGFAIANVSLMRLSVIQCNLIAMLITNYAHIYSNVISFFNRRTKSTTTIFIFCCCCTLIHFKLRVVIVIYVGN